MAKSSSKFHWGKTNPKKQDYNYKVWFKANLVRDFLGTRTTPDKANITVGKYNRYEDLPKLLFLHVMGSTTQGLGIRKTTWPDYFTSFISLLCVNHHPVWHLPLKGRLVKLAWTCLLRCTADFSLLMYNVIHPQALAFYGALKTIMHLSSAFPAMGDPGDTGSSGGSRKMFDCRTLGVAY